MRYSRARDCCETVRLTTSSTEGAFRGLSDSEAAERLRVHGPNELAARDRRHLLRILGDAFREPLLLLLIGTTALYFALGDIHEGLMLAALTLVTVIATAALRPCASCSSCARVVGT